MDVWGLFRPRLKIYPVTQFRLGLLYTTPDGIVEGDNTGGMVYQTCAAFQTTCGTKEGAVRFE